MGSEGIEHSQADALKGLAGIEAGMTIFVGWTYFIAFHKGTVFETRQISEHKVCHKPPRPVQAPERGRPRRAERIMHRP